MSGLQLGRYRTLVGASTVWFFGRGQSVGVRNSADDIMVEPQSEVYGRT